MPKKAILFAIKVAVTVGLFVLLFRPETFGLKPDQFGGVTPAKLWAEVKGADKANLFAWLAFAAAVKLAGMMAGVLRWRLLLQGQGLKMPFGYMVQSWFVGRFIGIFLPGTIGLDGYRLYDSTLYTREPIKSVTVIAVEKLIGFISLTFLVLLTFPFGFRLLNINVGVLAVILTGLAGFVTASFLLLLNPRVIQVLAAVLPTPAALRNKVDKLGAAVTAYSGNRTMLLGAVACGLCVHLGTCFMYFGTMMAIRAANTSLLDILFASPLMIYGTVLGPSVGGEGIREIVFATLLGAKSGVAVAVVFAHLGWWVGELVPFLVGLPIFIMRSRPDQDRVKQEIEAAHREAAATEAAGGLHLTPEATANYRDKVFHCILAGAGAGLIFGALFGFAEAGWLQSTLSGLVESSAFWWGPLVYGLLFACAGIGVAGGLCFLYLVADRFAPTAVTFALSLGGTCLCAAVIGHFRYMRDILQGHPLNPSQLLTLGAVFACAAIVLAAVGGGIALLFRGKRIPAVAAVVSVYICTAIFGSIYGSMTASGSEKAQFNPAVRTTGSNIILIAADALRADFLQLYSSDAQAETPNLDTLAADGVSFQKCFAQASWTKPSFASIFTGRYPESHKASKKASALPSEVTTVAELLQNGGYYTKGFANNPNITATLGFDKGFVDYVDLKPNLYFAAGYSASKLAGYEILRKVRNKVVSKLSKKLKITNFYQPAEAVTQYALEWLDSDERPTDAPFFLFVHYMDPHDPFMDHDRPGVGYARNILGEPKTGELREPMVKAYNSDIEHMDTHIGVLLDGLRERELYDDTLIVFVADHGEEFFDHEGWWHGQTLFDELIHVPLIVHLPGGARAGETNEQFARHIDLAPTFLHFARLKPGGEMSGKSLFRDDGYANGDITFVYAENDFENNVLQAVRTTDRKVIHANEDNPRGHAPVECYDLTADPREQNNLAESGACVGELGTLIEDMVASIESGAAEPVLADQSEAHDQLEALGYLGGDEEEDEM
ncbi:MAG: sulfatase-like hydrolase/transferase [Nitrospiraceae bacterium]|nr:sulfatase-like hydrolase/transferase [Nitrospiraceae bacterium]